jgi:hypothetical protein
MTHLRFSAESIRRLASSDPARDWVADQSCLVTGGFLQYPGTDTRHGVRTASPEVDGNLEPAKAIPSRIMTRSPRQRSIVQ